MGDSREIQIKNNEEYTRECEHCTREISFTEVNNYFQSKKGQEHVLDVLNDGDYTDNCLFPGDSVNEKITTTMPCPNCKGWIENIELEVHAKCEWDNHSDDSDNDGEPSCNGFFDCTIKVLWPEFDNDPLARWAFSPLGLEEVQTLKNKSLLMIVKTRMNGGHCYLGLSLEDNRIYRPIYNEAAGQCCWPKAIPMQVGSFYGFKKTFRNPSTDYPHKSNDIVVAEELKEGSFTQEAMYEHLLPFAKTSVNEIFNDMLTIQDNGKCYVHEGTKCESFGIVKVKSKSISYDKPRLNFSDATNQTFNLSWTSSEDLDSAKERVACGTDNDLLIIVGLGRPWDYDGFFQRPRCYLIAIGLEVSKTKNLKRKKSREDDPFNPTKMSTKRKAQDQEEVTKKAKKVEEVVAEEEGEEEEDAEEEEDDLDGEDGEGEEDDDQEGEDDEDGGEGEDSE